MTSKLRFGIIGCGVIGHIHAEAIATLPDAQLVAVVDTVLKPTQELMDEFHVTHYGNLQEMLAREQLDVVDVCTPSGMHGEHACQVMRAGVNVIVEKPMEVSRAAIEEMLRVQQETGVKLAVSASIALIRTPSRCMIWWRRRHLADWSWATPLSPGGVRRRTMTVEHGAGPGSWMGAAY